MSNKVRKEGEEKQRERETDSKVNITPVCVYTMLLYLYFASQVNPENTLKVNSKLTDCSNLEVEKDGKTLFSHCACHLYWKAHSRSFLL